MQNISSIHIKKKKKKKKESTNTFKTNTRLPKFKANSNKFDLDILNNTKFRINAFGIIAFLEMSSLLINMNTLSEYYYIFVG